jgi:hypothetical protein
MNAAMAEAAAAMMQAAIATARAGRFVIKNSTATTWDVPKKTM